MRIRLIPLLWILFLNSCLYCLHAQDESNSGSSSKTGISEMQTVGDTSKTEVLENDTTGAQQDSSNFGNALQQASKTDSNNLAKTTTTSDKSKSNQLISKYHFYQKWWFSLLILLFLSPLFYRYFNSNKSLQLKKIDELNN
jgi:hypothetical protein